MMLRAENDNLTYDEFEAGVKPTPSIAPVRMDAQVILQGRVPGGFIVLQKTVKPGPDGMPVLTAAPLAMMPIPSARPTGLWPFSLRSPIAACVRGGPRSSAVSLLTNRPVRWRFAKNRIIMRYVCRLIRCEQDVSNNSGNPRKKG
jgi:hypothetical protein